MALKMVASFLLSWGRYVQWGLEWYVRQILNVSDFTADSLSGLAINEHCFW